MYGFVFTRRTAPVAKTNREPDSGLAITKEIIKAHNENINVVSTEGVGSEFTFSLSKATTDSEQS